MRRRRPALLALVLPAVGGCGLFGGGVSEAVVVAVEVTALDLDAPWDSPTSGPFAGDRPDVYVDVVDLDRQSSFLRTDPAWRSDVAENVGALPLSFRAPADVEGLDLAAEVEVRVADYDGATAHDLMFTTGPFRLADLYDGAEAGTTARLPFETDGGRVVVTVRWE